MISNLKARREVGLEVIQDGEQVSSPDDASNHEIPVVPFDVVLIHGIYGSSPDSWTTGSETIWINKALACASESKGRIMSYGYHTDIETGRYYTPRGVYQEAEALLEALRKLRTSEITGARRPVHFFSHDVGGTIVKAALAMATDQEDKYADILHCTRAMVRNLEAVLRLTAQQQQKWSGHMVGYAKDLTETITKVNDAFLGTQMLTQANFINVVSNLHLDPAQQHVALRKMISQASPVQPYQKVDEDWQNSDLLELPKRKEALIMHMRCSSGTEAATENASFFLDKNRSGTFDPLLYIKFDTHDIRFNNCAAMLRTFLARFICNRLQTGSLVSRPLNTLIRCEALYRFALFTELWDLQGTKEHVKSFEYCPKEPVPFPVDTKASNLIRKLGGYLGETGRHEKVLQTCIAYIQDGAGSPEDAVQSIPYVIEFWPKHWQLSEASEKQLLDLFENELLFSFWTNSLFALPHIQLKPPPTHVKPLPVAAHLGFTTVVKALLERSQNIAESRGQALIEACRAGHVPLIRYLIGSYSDGIDFGDENLHEAARVVSNSHDDEALRELLKGLPESLKASPMAEESEVNLKVIENRKKNLPQEHLSDEATRDDHEATGLQPDEPISSPRDWLVMPMYRAVRSGMSDVVTKLLKLGLEPCPPKGITPSDNSYIYTALTNSHVSCAKLLIDAGASPTAKNAQGYTPLHVATRWSSGETVEFLLSCGASIADKDLQNRTALEIAAIWGDFTTLAIMLSRTEEVEPISEGDLDIVKLLIENKATVDKREAPPDEGWSRTPMHVAVDWNRPEIAQYLLEKGADPDARDSDGIPVIGAAISGGHSSMVQWLADANVDVNVTYYNDKLTPLHEACPHPEIVRLLIQHGADINKVNADSRSALNFSISGNNLATVQILLESKTQPDLDAATIHRDLRTILPIGYIEVVETMLEAGADVNNVNENGESLLAYAVKHNAPSGMIRKILEYNPDLEMRDKKENTALHCITRSTSLETVRLVVNAGGRLDVLNSDKDTPLIVAIGAQLDDIVFYMLKKEPSLLTQGFITSQQRVTPLHEACRFGSLAMVRSLIDREMDVNSCCEGVYGTPLISATLRRDLLSSPLASDIIALLLVNGACPRSTGGLFQYPLISACLACPTDTVRLLLNSDTSTQDQDSLNRKVVHLACYNSLAVLNLLEIPDSDFAAADVLGRVPLHYAVMTGDVELVEVVLERSERIGISIDAKDDDGWTPLLWAARAARIWNRQLETEFSSSSVISLLLKHGADPAIKGFGVDRDWTVCEVACYHHADFVEDLIDRPSNEKIRSRKRGSAPGSQDNENAYCDSCLIESHGIFFDCSICFDFSLCFKCHRTADKIHPDHSSFTRCGSEWDEDDVSKDEDIQEMSLNDGAGIGDQDVLLDLEEIPYEDFDSEVSE
ncbi:Ankyrin-1 [Fusarium oxysporum f. sp. cubense race 1]|uniref:Ankyrin-1 n=1 Tax=Fusarium oxysporum f. sp. cubense (strain race 1) TaxID=1229664 RepID=N4U974_FUSC1|nr:Ankyrin-1 [Fusarium oxysporum f. sp. cubense race 1]